MLLFFFCVCVCKCARLSLFSFSLSFGIRKVFDITSLRIFSSSLRIAEKFSFRFLLFNSSSGLQGLQFAQYSFFFLSTKNRSRGPSYSLFSFSFSLVLFTCDTFPNGMDMIGEIVKADIYIHYVFLF